MLKIRYPKISIVIPTLGRNESLARCIQSIKENYYPNYEIITVATKGLVRARNEGLNKASGEIVIFTDDDVIVNIRWLKQIARSFEDKEVGGVTGGTIIPTELRNNRDLLVFNKSILGKIYNWLVLENKQYDYARQFKSGGFSLGSTLEIAKKLSYSFECDWLEGCNMAFRTKIIKMLDGFDETYGGCGDYSEPDMAFRVKRAGYKLVYNPKAYLYHNISLQRGDISDASQRIFNLMAFHQRYFNFNWRFLINLIFINGYFVKKAIENKDKRWLNGVATTHKCLLQRLWKRISV